MRVDFSKIEKDIKVYIVGIGYETPHEEIFRACDKWVGHVDGMIWGDGRFDFFPANNDFSENGWLDAIEKRYKDKCDFVPYQYSGRQVDKRQMYLDIAGKRKADVAIAVDTDEYLDPNYLDFDTFYRNLVFLMDTTKDRMFSQWVYIPSRKLWARQGNEFPGGWRPSVKIHKNPGTMRFCVDRHYIWCSKKVSDEKLYKWQMKNPDKENPYEFVSHYTIDGVRVRMDRTLRSKEFNKKQEEWAFINSHAENSRQFYAINKVRGFKPPTGYSSWDEFEKAPHSFDRKTGKRIEL